MEMFKVGGRFMDEDSMNWHWNQSLPLFLEMTLLVVLKSRYSSWKINEKEQQIVRNDAFK